MSELDISVNDSLQSDSNEISDPEVAVPDSSEFSQSDEEKAGDEVNEEIINPVKLSACGTKITSYFGIPLDYAKKTPHHRDRKLRPSNYDKKTNKPKKPPVGKKKCKSKTYNNPKKVRERIDTYNKNHSVVMSNKQVVHCTPEPFGDSFGMLFCLCCRETLPLHVGSINYHCGAKKHIDNKLTMQGSEEKKQIILQSIENFKALTSTSGMTNLSDREKLFRYDVVLSFLRSGDPFYSIDEHRALLEKHCLKITEATHLTNYIPIIVGDEMKRLVEEIEQAKVQVIFDGASFDGECFVLMFRFLKNCKICQRRCSS